MGCTSGKQCSAISSFDKQILQEPMQYGRGLINQLVNIEIQIEQLRSQMYKENDIEYEKSEFIISFDFDYNTIHQKSYKRQINSNLYIERMNQIKQDFVQMIPSLAAYTSALKKRQYKHDQQMQIEEICDKIKYKYTEVCSYLNCKRSSKTSIQSKEISSPINSSDTFQTTNEAYCKRQ